MAFITARIAVIKEASKVALDYFVAFILIKADLIKLIAATVALMDYNLASLDFVFHLLLAIHIKEYFCQKLLLLENLYHSHLSYYRYLAILEIQYFE
jgi:hypothetical protein